MMNTNGQIFLDQFTTSRATLRCVSWIDLNHFSSSIFSFIRNEFKQFIPRSIGNALCQSRVFDHIRDFQFLENNQIEVINQVTGNLMRKVVATIFDSFVNLCRAFSVFLSLRFRQVFFIKSKKLRVINFRSIRQCAKGFDSDITTYAFACWLKNFSRCFNRKAGKPFPVVLLVIVRVLILPIISRCHLILKSPSLES